jgi:hypothetical protein
MGLTPEALDNPYWPGGEYDVHYYDGAYLDNSDIVLDMELNHMAGHNYFDGASSTTLRSLVESGKHIFIVMDRTGCSSCYTKMAGYADIIEANNLTSRDDIVIMSILSDTATGSHSFESWSANGDDLVAVIDGGDTFFGIGEETGHPFYLQFIWDDRGRDFIGYGGNFIIINSEGRIFIDDWEGDNVDLDSFVEMITTPPGGGGFTNGCTDDTACNYNPAADTDDGSCLYEDGMTECWEDTEDNGTFETPIDIYLECNFESGESHTCESMGYSPDFIPAGCVAAPVATSAPSTGGPILNNPELMSDRVLGDCNDDGYIDIRDLLTIENLLSKNLYHECADLNGKGWIHNNDLIGLIDMILGDFTTIKPNNLESINIREWIKSTDKETGIFTRGIQVSNQTMMNPVLATNMWSEGADFLLKMSRETYSPGNPIYDKYNGEYHTHSDGSICAGPHDMGFVNHDRMLIDNTLPIRPGDSIRDIDPG